MAPQELSGGSGAEIVVFQGFFSSMTREFIYILATP
jgi:hypothetical protein